MSRTNDQHENGFILLFNCDSSAKLKAMCKTSVLMQSDFADAIIYGKTAGTPYECASVFRRIHPDHLTLTDEDNAALAATPVGPHSLGSKKVFNKIMATFSERKIIASHMFWIPNTDLWWIIYFSQRDVSFEDSHWDKGAHLHILSSLTHAKLDPHAVMAGARDDPKPNLPSGLHVRYVRDNEGD